MKRKYDSYEIEIVISLSLLVVILISLSFLSGYAFENARRWQLIQFDENLNLAVENAKLVLENDIDNWRHSDIATLKRLRDLSAQTGIADISVTDTLGNVISAISSHPEIKSKNSYFEVRRPIVNRDGKIMAYVIFSSINTAGIKFQLLSRWDAVFRIAGLLSALVVGAFFLKSILSPYRRIKREAIDYNLDWGDNEKNKGTDYIIATFKNIVAELEEKKGRLEQMYATSEKRADSLARYNEDILGSITSGVMICDSSGIITRLNRSAQTILKYFEKDCLGRHYRDIFGLEHKLTMLFDDALQRKVVHSRIEFEIKRPDNDKLWIGCSSSMINDEKGDGMGAAILMIDLTEIRKLQEISSFNEKMASLGQTAAGLAHEIRNSFATIVGFATLLKKSIVDDPQIAKHVDSIRNESMAAESLLSRFLDFAKPLEPRIERIHIKSLIDSALQCLHHPGLSNIKVTQIISHDLSDYMGDSALLRQALINLLLNSCDAISGNGEIRIEAYVADKAHAINKTELVIAILDNGAGIDSKVIGKIFDPFFSDKKNGTGLGLALVKKIVVLHNGLIEVHSKKGRGTKFTVRLPIIRDIAITDKKQIMSFREA